MNEPVDEVPPPRPGEHRREGATQEASEVVASRWQDTEGRVSSRPPFAHRDVEIAAYVGGGLLDVAPGAQRRGRGGDRLG